MMPLNSQGGSTLQWIAVPCSASFNLNFPIDESCRIERSETYGCVLYKLYISLATISSTSVSCISSRPDALLRRACNYGRLKCLRQSGAQLCGAKRCRLRANLGSYHQPQHLHHHQSSSSSSFNSKVSKCNVSSITM